MYNFKNMFKKHKSCKKIKKRVKLFRGINYEYEQGLKNHRI